MNSFKRCFKKKLPYSLLLYPCIPCVGDGNAFYLILASVICLCVYFATKFIFRHNIKTINHLNNNTWVPYYFAISYALAMSIVIAILIAKKQHNKKKFKLRKVPSLLISSFGIGIILLLTCLASLKVYDALYHLPIIGPIITNILEIIESYLGTNTPRIIASWWGIALSWLFIFIPLIGPYISSFITLVPQNQFVLYIGYLIVCFIHQ